MNLHQVLPTQEQMAALMAYPKDQPIVMANIIKFKDQVEGREESGRAAYARYTQNVLPLLQKAAARVLWKGDVAYTLVGDSDDQPDILFLVEYPSVDHFLLMVQSEAYREIARDRTIALSYGGLLACQASKGPF
ncbi:MAG: DUF1330 domain-containing protein [Bacteroidota bacterium]